MPKSTDKYKDFLNRLNECVTGGDPEVDHSTADGILSEIALDTELTKKQRVILVDRYNQVTKWYA
jgi:hypothetical protein